MSERILLDYPLHIKIRDSNRIREVILAETPGVGRVEMPEVFKPLQEFLKEHLEEFLEESLESDALR